MNIIDKDINVTNVKGHRYVNIVGGKPSANNVKDHKSANITSGEPNANTVGGHKSVRTINDDTIVTNVVHMSCSFRVSA